ncbi:MAG: lysine--tRNA ligase [Candidatus Parcubacteria bacterium]|nr:lysine--tRNA ligase [Candidatus Parcubacteria bacterium]
MPLEDLRQTRINKALSLRKKGIDPFPAISHRQLDLSEVNKQFSVLEKSGKSIITAGRIFSIRPHGKLVFIDLKDEKDELQLLLKTDEIGEDNLKFWLDHLDMGDYVEIEGPVFITKAGEKTILAKTVTILTKAIRPLPTEWYGLKDTETLLRKRYLDLIMNKETKELFYKKTVFWDAIREFLKKYSFLEVETPVLENIPGGAEAEPFITHYNALDRDFYLRISLELALKRLIVGGFERVFEIGRVFRNEGVDAQHLQDYTQMEFYWSYADYNKLMDLTEEMYKFVVQRVMGSLTTTYNGGTIDWSKPWPKVDYYELFKEKTSLDLKTVAVSDLYKKAMELKLNPDKNLGKGRLIDLIYKKACRPTLTQPCFLINHPIEVSPLAKSFFEDHGRTQRFQILVSGAELGNGFSELNDPLDQRERFEEQMKLRESGDKEAQMIDDDFIEALEYGMPPTAGFGLSERFFSFIVDRPVRETTFFPATKNSD